MRSGIYFLLLGLLGCGSASPVKSAQAQSSNAPCPVVAEGTVEKVRGDSMAVYITGVSIALKHDTTFVRPGLVIRLMDCGF
jgi:hypothetical protein